MNLNAQWKTARLNALDGIIVSDRAYNAVIGIVVLWGLAVNYLMNLFFAEPILSMHIGVMIIAYFAGSAVGMLTVYKSKSAVVSFFGFTILAAAMGLFLIYVLQIYSHETIAQAVRVTAATTTVMLVLAVIRPQFFLGLGRTLITALLVCAAAQFVLGMLLKVPLMWMDWVIALIFCGYIGYDWSKAQLYPKTLDNAIDSAADIYVDVVNLFIRILRMIDRRDTISVGSGGSDPD